MKEKDEKVGRERHGGRWRRAVRVSLLCLAGAAALVVLLVCAATLWLTGDRLSRIFDERASEYLDADVRTRRIDFTLWSTFPHLCLEIDSLEVVSRSLGDAVAKLPAGSDKLLSLKSMKGSVNVIKLLAGDVNMHDVDVEGLRMNLVVYNDSVNNFSIFPTTPDKKFELPYITADRVRVRGMHDITLYSAPYGLRALACVTEASLERRSHHEGKGDAYDLRLGGKLDSSFGRVTLTKGLPFRFDGMVDVNFSPLGVKMENMNVGLANMRSRMSMDMAFGEETKISNFSTDISAFELMRLLEFLPSEWMPDLSGLKADLSAVMSLRLTRPFSFQSGELPWFEADFTIPPGNVDYRFSDGTVYRLHDVELHAVLAFNGERWERSSVDITGLRAMGDGLSLLLEGKITDAFGRPDLKGRLSLRADLARAIGNLPVLARYGLAGDADVKANFNVNLATLATSGISELSTSGDVALSGVGFRLPGGESGELRSGNLSFSGSPSCGYAGGGVLRGVEVRLADGGKITAPQVDVDVADVVGRSYSLTADLADVAYAAAKGSDIATLTADRLRAETSAGGPVKLKADGMTAAFADGVKLAAGNVTGRYGDTSGLSLDGQTVATAFDTSEGHVWLTARGMAVELSDGGGYVLRADTLLARLRSADKDLDGARLTLLNAVVGIHDGHYSLLAPGGSLAVSLLPGGLQISDADLAYGRDTLTLRNIGLRSGHSYMTLAGREWKDADGVANVNLRLRADTLHFNELAHAWQSGSGHISTVSDSAIINAPTPLFMPPKNVRLAIDATAEASVYTNLWLEDLHARFTMAPERVALDTLSLVANFGEAGLGVVYDCPDPQNLEVLAGATFKNFNLQKFFGSYPNVLAMMPQMANLHGVFNLQASGYADIFPSMVMVTPSLVADIDVDGHDLYVHQDHFIRRLARMLLLREKGNIYIPNISAHARAYDELLTLYPFNIDIGTYKLLLEGRNDFSGFLDYHVSVLHNPILPFRFGVNIEGDYHKPKLRFASDRWDERRSMEVTHIDNHFDINVIKELRKLGLKLLHHAAEAEADTASTAQTVPTLPTR